MAQAAGPTGPVGGGDASDWGAPSGSLPLYRDRARAGSFGEDAARYDRARPTYPETLVDRLLAERPRTVLDVGCGTGIASRRFAARGLDVTGVEPDPRMAAVARSHGLLVEDGTFERWDAGGRCFDLLVSGQAWHWVEPEAGTAKAAQVVKEGGRIGLFWNLGHPPPELRRRLDAIYASWAPGLEARSVLLGRGDVDRIRSGAERLRRHHAWVDVEVATFPLDVTYRTDQWTDHLRTHSDHAALAPEQLRSLVDDVGRAIDRGGGSFVMHYESVLVTARRA